MSERAEDELLMVQYIGGDEAAFRELFQRYKARVYGYLLKRTDAKTADDLFQKVFLNLHRSRSSYEQPRLFSAWLFSICRNVVRDHFRAEARKPATTSADEELAALSSPVGDGSEDEVLKEVLSQMTPKQQEAVRLRYADNLGFDEIARAMNTTQANVRQMVSRAVRKIRGAQ